MHQQCTSLIPHAPRHHLWSLCSGGMLSASVLVLHRSLIALSVRICRGLTRQHSGAASCRRRSWR